MSRTLQPVRTRLSDLAVQAGVSTATVSRVLNGKAGVSGETRQAVLAALDLLGYERPEKLKSHSAGLIGLVVPELTNPVFPAFAQVIESRLSEHGYTPLLCTQSPGGTTEAGLRILEPDLKDLIARTVAAALARAREISA